jgi:multiple sugar transport system permease protein
LETTTVSSECVRLRLDCRFCLNCRFCLGRRIHLSSPICINCCIRHSPCLHHPGPFRRPQARERSGASLTYLQQWAVEKAKDLHHSNQAAVALELVLGMMFALVMHRAIFGRRTVRTSILIPYGIITVVAAFSWFYAFDPGSGFVNNLPLIDPEKAWFGDRFSAFAVIILAEVWKTTPFIALLLLAGLTTIDEGLYEAAKVDGANAVQRFFRITLPLMVPAIAVALLFRTLDAFRIFDTVFIMTGGGQQTETLSILGYNQLISRLNLGLGSAVSVLIFFLVLAIAFMFVRFLGVSVPGREREAK